MAASGSTSRTGGALRPGPALAVGAVAVALVVLAAWRSTMGISLADDSYYAAATLRLAQGAHLFADEMFLQSVGFLAALPFAKLWTLLFSTTGFVAALRVFYVALGSAAAFVVYRVLRPSFGRWPALAAAAAPLLAPAYNLLAVSYDTMAVAGMVLACVLGFAALRDGSRRAALFAGAAAAFACVSYPPMVLAAFALLGTFWWLGRGRRLVLPMVTGAVVVVALFAAWLATQATLADLRATLDYIRAAAQATGPARPGGHAGEIFGNLFNTLARSWVVPVWVWFAPATAIAVTASLPGMRTQARERARGLVLAALPFALALPVVANSLTVTANGRVWTLGGNYLIAFVVFAFAPMVADLGTMPAEMRRLLDLVVPPALAGWLVVTLVSSASLYWASGIVGLAPLAVATIVWWATTVGKAFGPVAGPVAVLCLVAALIVLLFGGTFDEPPAWALHHVITTGTYAGITTTEARAQDLAARGALTARWVGAGTGVLFVDSPGGYLTLGPGVPVTPATWLDHGSADGAATAYFDRIGRWPDVVFVATDVWGPATAPGVPRDFDPLLSDIARTYRVAETSSQTGLTVLVRR